jgi:hypothetical protein
MTQHRSNQKEAAVKADKLQRRGNLFPSDTPLHNISKRKEMVSCSCSRLEVKPCLIDHEVIIDEGSIEARTVKLYAGYKVLAH